MKLLMNAFFVAIVLFTSNNMFAQDKTHQKAERSPETMSQRHAEKMKSDLNLNDEQTKKVYEVNLKYNKERQANREKRSQEHAKKMAEAKNKNEQKNAEMKNILTADQYSKMIQNQEANKAKMKQKRQECKDRKGQKMRKDKAPVKE